MFNKAENFTRMVNVEHPARIRANLGERNGQPDEEWETAATGQEPCRGGVMIVFAVKGEDHYGQHKEACKSI